jgi:hypothetical protein
MLKETQQQHQDFLLTPKENQQQRPVSVLTPKETQLQHQATIRTPKAQVRNLLELGLMQREIQLKRWVIIHIQRVIKQKLQETIHMQLVQVHLQLVYHHMQAVGEQ